MSPLSARAQFLFCTGLYQLCGWPWVRLIDTQTVKEISEMGIPWQSSG